jgi:hypothetical protein
MDEKIKAMFIFEILGRPPEYVKQSLEEHILDLEKIEGVKILNKKIHEPKELNTDKLVKNKKLEKEDSKDLYTSFAEVELTANNLILLFSVTFRLLPSHVEIISPDELRLKNFDLNSIISELAIKLHRYDEVAKILTIENQSLRNHVNLLHAKGIKIEEIKKHEIKKDESVEKK